MEKYKKKSLNFMGFSRDLRKSKRDEQRCVSRLKRFSIARPLDDESINEEKKEESSRIPTIGKPKTLAGSRVELLQKWKQEKMVKKQQESKLKKPAFKVGVTKPIPSPSVGNKPLFALDASSRLFKSSFQVSNSQLFGKKQESFVASNMKTSMKVPNSQSSAKKPGVATDNLKSSAKDMKIQTSKSKIGIASKPENKWTKNKESGIESLSVKPKVDASSKVMNKESGIKSLSMKPKVDASSKVMNKDQLSGRKLPTLTSKPLETKKESRLQPLNMKSKIVPTAKGLKSNIPSSGLPKPSTCRTLNKVPDQHIPGKNNIKSIPKFSKPVASQQKGIISEKTSTSESRLPNKPHDNFPTFECELSHIEPVEEQRKSFAPKGFVFQPPAELSSSLFLEDGPSAIFLRMRSQFLRTSTPKQDPSDRKSSSEIKDIKNEDVACLEENSESSKNTNTEYEPENKNDLETLLSSSLGLVSLNDMKPTDCKQSLKFESLEVVSTRNPEEMLSSSKIILPEHSLTTEPPPTVAINPPILPDSVEIDKTEMNSANTSPADDNKIAVVSPEIDSVFSEGNDMPDENQFLSIGLRKQENRPVKIPMKTRNFRQSEKPALMSINESLENTPKSALKKKLLESDFTPRRSLRLAKLSGNFSSLDNLLDFQELKDKDRTGPKGNLTPRRSKRLSKFSTEFYSAENLFDVRRPTVFETPEKDRPVPKMYSKVTYDFDRLSSEMEEETRPCATGKVSLLPISRPSIMRRSIKGDLMSFSPDV